MGIKVYPPPTGGASPETTTTAGFDWPNGGEYATIEVPAGTVGWMTVGRPVYITDGTNKGTLYVLTVNAESPELPGVQVVFLQSVANPSVGTTSGASTLYAGGFPS